MFNSFIFGYSRPSKLSLPSSALGVAILMLGVSHAAQAAPEKKKPEASSKPASRTAKPTPKVASTAAKAIVAPKPSAAKPTSASIKPPAAKRAGKNQTLAKITSDHDSNVSRLVAVIDDQGVVQGIRFDTKVFEKTPAVTTTKSYSIKDIASDSGVVLLNSSGYDAVLLKGTVDSKAGTGKIEVRYLSSALWSSYETCRATVRRDDSGVWQVINSQNRAVDEFFVQSHSTGITTIRGICL